MSHHDGSSDWSSFPLNSGKEYDIFLSTLRITENYRTVKFTFYVFLNPFKESLLHRYCWPARSVPQRLGRRKLPAVPWQSLFAGSPGLTVPAATVCLRDPKAANSSACCTECSGPAGILVYLQCGKAGTSLDPLCSI